MFLQPPLPPLLPFGSVAAANLAAIRLLLPRRVRLPWRRLRPEAHAATIRLLLLR
jgi:hypothetical protein